MPPKPPAKGGKAGGGEPDLAAQLPSDLPAECPFPFTWHACGVVVTCSDPSHLSALKEALAKLQGQQQLSVTDLVAKLDPASPLAQDVSAAQAATGVADVSSLPAPLLAQVLDSAFAADQQLAWKQQLVTRRAALAAAEATLAAATQAEAAAASAHEAAAKAVADAAAAAAQHEEGEEPAEAAAAAEEGEEGAEESPLQVAKAALEAAQAATSSAADGVAAAQQQLDAPWDCYQTYWLDGLPTSEQGLAAVVAAGVPVRAVLVVTPPAPATDAAGAEGAAGGSSAAGAAAPADPLALAAAAAEWGSPLSGVAVLVVGQGTPSSCLSTGVPSSGSKNSVLSSPAWITTLAAEAAAAKAAAEVAAADKPGGKGGAGKAPAAKGGGKGAPPGDAALLELSGLQELARALATAPSVAKLYDEWKAATEVYQLAELAPQAGEQQGGGGARDQALYRHLLSTVEPERQSVPVLLHAMLEQVCRNVQDKECIAEADAGLTLSQAEAAIAAVMDRVLLPAGPLLAPTLPEKQQLPCISQSDELAAAAYGIGSGQVHPKQAGNAAAAGEEGVTGLYGLMPEEVDAAELHLLSLVQRPGQRALPPAAGDDAGGGSGSDALARRIQQQQLQEHCKGLPLAAVERWQLQQSLAGLLPPQAAAAHGEGVLGRVHLERLDARALQQALLQASVELPAGASRHYPSQDVTLVAYYADATSDSGRKLMPVALNFHQYWQELLLGAGAAPQLPGKVYRMRPALAEQGWERRWLYTATGGVVSRGPEGLLSVHKGDLCLKLSAADNGTHQLLGTLKHGTTLAAGVRPAKQQHTAPAAAAAAGDAAAAAEADPEAAAPEAAEGAAAAEGGAAHEESAVEEAGDAGAAAGVTPAPSPGYVQVVTPDGVLVEVTTGGVVLMAPLHQERLQVPAARGVDTLGAPIAPGHLSSLLPEGTYDWQALLPDGSLIKQAPASAPGGEPVTTILSPSGEVAQLQRRQLAGQQVVGWVRSAPDGRRMWVADEACLEQLRAAAAAAAGARAAAKAAAEAAAAAAAEAAAAAAAEAASKKGGKGAKLAKSPSKGERAASASSTRDGEGGEGEAGGAGGAGGSREHGSVGLGVQGDVVVAEAPLRAVQVTDAESGAVVHTREDGLLLVTYADGSKLLQDAAGSRLASQEGGCWQFEGQGVPHVTSDAQRITCTPCPGLTLTWDRLTSCVSLSLPGAALLAVAPGGTACYSPQPNPTAVQLLLDLTASPAAGGGGLGLQEAAAQEECRGLLGVALEAGCAALWEAEDCHLYLSPGAQVAAWVCGEPPAPVEPPPEPAAGEAGAVGGGEAADGQGEADKPSTAAADGSSSPGGAAAEAAPAAAAEAEAPVRPVAASVAPRLFIIHPSGDGFELLDPAVFRRYLAEAGPESTVKVTPVTKGAEPGSQRYSFLRPYTSSSRDLSALPLAESVVPVASAAAGAAPLGSLRRPDTVTIPAPGGSVQMRLPRIAAVSPAPGQPAGLATRAPGDGSSSSSQAPVVLVGREVIQVPQMTPEVRVAAEAALSSCRAATESAQAVVASRAPPADGRSAEEQQEEADVSALLQQLALSLPGLAAAAAELEGEAAAAAQAQQAVAEEATAASALADAEKLASKRKLRTKKVGPYDTCQQLPAPGTTMSYWTSPEGLEAQKQHGDQLQQSLTRDKLRPVKPPPNVTAGKQLQPGVYLAHSTQLGEDIAAFEGAAAAAAGDVGASSGGAEGDGEADDPLLVSMRSTHRSKSPLRTSTELTSSLLRQSLGATIKAGGAGSGSSAASPGRGAASGLQSTAAMVAAAGADYGYPSMGYSQKVQSPQTLQARSRGAGLDVYGNVRAVAPALPASHLREEARRSLNAGYLAREAGPLRGASTASASLIKYYGRAGQHLAIHPGSLAFTGLQQGATGRTTVSLLNTSATPARFHVVQPAPPLRVVYKPGPVPPGLEVPLTIEFTAATPGAFHGEIVVKGEVNVLTLTVDALVEESLAPPAPPAAATEEHMEEAVA